MTKSSDKNGHKSSDKKACNIVQNSLTTINKTYSSLWIFLSLDRPAEFTAQIPRDYIPVSLRERTNPRKAYLKSTLVLASSWVNLLLHFSFLLCAVVEQDNF